MHFITAKYVQPGVFLPQTRVKFSKYCLFFSLSLSVSLVFYFEMIFVHSECEGTHFSKSLNISNSWSDLVRAANPLLGLRVMKSIFVCKVWNLSIMHMFWYVNRTRTHSLIDAKITIENSMRHTLHHYNMVYPKWRFYNTWIFVRDSPLKVCCMSFWIFLLVAKGPVFVSLLLQRDHSESAEE